MPLTEEGVRIDANPVPLWARKAWTLPQAAQVFSLDYQGVRLAALKGDLDTFRPPNKHGDPGRRHVTEEAMLSWIKGMEE
ncbi:hypothetical protein [Bifidobacterium callitrichos]|uniref:Uncharacterized protein n=1 Tax=Bifidobacterium callitrichos DSM 23973 TaxID=1437609 RepID=A0A087ACQ4_9BIFI|nr:hypothetical protein [Bifidobacterium callitrichos]KFI56554.1 hypothetical protein BCAL_0149 [Bifidobacterium callitrichos DSM 23973]